MNIMNWTNMIAIILSAFAILLLGSALEQIDEGTDTLARRVDVLEVECVRSDPR